MASSLKPMPFYLAKAVLLVAASSLLGSYGCSSKGSGHSDPAPLKPVVTVSPSEATLTAGFTEPFTAQVTQTTNSNVAWSVQESDGGQIDKTGLYTAPSNVGTFHVQATSLADPSRFAVGKVSVVAAPISTLTMQNTLLVGATGITASVPAQAGTFDWSIKGGDITAGTGTHAITFSVVGNVGSTVEVSCTVTNPAGTSSTGNAQARVYMPGPVPDATISIPPPVAAGSAGNVAAVPAQEGVFTWTLTGGWITAGAGTRAITFQASADVGESIQLTCTILNSVGNSAFGQASLPVRAVFSPTIITEMGHLSDPDFARCTDTRALTLDRSNHWVLWDLQRPSILAFGDTPSSGTYQYTPVDLAGTTVAVETWNGITLKQLDDGQTIGTVSAPHTWWKLAKDGSYLCLGSSSGFSVWNPSGQQIFFKSGDYSQAVAFAAANEVWVAKGPGGQQVIEALSVSNGTSTLSPVFSGGFRSWLLDGSGFLTNSGTTVCAYTPGAIQKAIAVLPFPVTLGGTGNWVWSSDGLYHPGYKFSIYPMGSYQAAMTFDADFQGNFPFIPAGNKLIYSTGGSTFSIVDLSGTSLAKTDYPTPAEGQPFAALPNGKDLLLRGGNGKVLVWNFVSGIRFPLNSGGPLRTIAGSRSLLAVSDASDQITCRDANTLEIKAIIPFAATKLDFSRDGTILAASSTNGTKPMFVYSLPSGDTQDSWTPGSNYFALSPNGTKLGRGDGSYNGSYTTTKWYATDLSTWTDTVFESSRAQGPLSLSPDGNSCSIVDMPYLYSSFTGPSTRVYQNGILVTAIPGRAIGWLDNGKLLVNSYTQSHGSFNFENCGVYDVNGTFLSSTNLPELTSFQSLNNDAIYSPEKNAVYSLSSGSTLWTTPQTYSGIGVVCGPNIVYLSGTRILAEPHGITYQ